MSEVKIDAELRSTFGKGAARQARRAGKVPAVLYEYGKEPIHVNFNTREVFRALRTPNVLLSVNVESKEYLAVPREVQRHPVTRDLEHIDLLLVHKGEKITIELPIHIVGDTVPGGLLNQVADFVEVEAEATKLPEPVEIVLDELPIGTVIHASDLKLPSGTTLVSLPDTQILSITEARSMAVAETTEEDAESAE